MGSRSKTMVIGVILLLAIVSLFQCVKEKQKALELKDYIVNLADKGGNRFLKLKMKVVVENNSALTEISENDAKISDAIITFLSNKRVADLDSPMGKKVLKRQMKDLFNEKLLKRGDVVEIYFVNFVIQ